MRNPSDPFYGDKYPPIGYSGGEIDIPELVEILQILLDVGYLSKANRGTLVLELQPFPGQTADESVADNFDRVNRAWKRVVCREAALSLS